MNRDGATASVNEQSRPPTMAIGITSIAMALIAAAVLIYFALNSYISFQTDAVVFVTSTSVLVGYAGVSLSMLGLVLGVVGYLRRTSQKLFAITGAVMNVTLLLAVLSVYGAFHYLF
jgi:hypothetical protein